MYIHYSNRTMFKLTQPTKVEQFVTIFSNLKGFTEYITLRLEENKMFVQGMDNSHISMFEINLSKEWFDEYLLETELVVGISTDTLQKILSTRKQQHGIMFDNITQEQLTISLFDTTNTDTKNRIYPKEFTISLVDLDIEDMHVPDQDHDVDIEFQSKHLKSLLDEIVMFNDTLTFTCNDDEVIFQCKNDTCTFNINIPTDLLSYFSYREAPKLAFNVKYLHMFLQFNKLGNNVWLHLNENSPLRCKYLLDTDVCKNNGYHDNTHKSNVSSSYDEKKHESDDEDNELPTSKNTVTFYLAPKINDAEEDK